ncbi:hypothetical protein O9X98_10195 [Agrobacterium salinitolerans]|nr:hypothetical protein [Agrobacterium salinitolerans]
MTGKTAHEIGIIEPVYIHEARIESDEARLFAAHRQVAKKGNGSEFPLAVKAKLSAPMIPRDGGQAKVATMDIDTTGMLLLHNWDDATHKLAVQGHDEDGDFWTYHYYEYNNPDKFGHPGLVMQGPRYHDHFKHVPDYLRHLVLGFAQSEFSAGVADLAARGRFDEEIDSLSRRIRTDVDAAFDNIFYVVSHDGGYFVSRTNQPRLVMEKSTWGDGDIYLKLRHGRFDASSNWMDGLLSFPAELSLSATAIRNAVVTAETHSDWMDRGPSDMDDVIFKTGIPVKRDLGNLDNLRNAEFVIYANAVSDMTRAVISHRGTSAFSSETIAACSWFARIERLDTDYPMDLIVPTWDGRMTDLVAALRDDDDAFSEFLARAEWPLLASPLTVMTAKLNRLLDRDVLYGMTDAAPAHKASATPGI